MDEAAAIDPASDADGSFLRRWLDQTKRSHLTWLSSPKGARLRGMFDIVGAFSVILASLIASETGHGASNVPGHRQAIAVALLACCFLTIVQRSMRPRACSLFEPLLLHAVIAAASTGVATSISASWWIMLGLPTAEGAEFNKLDWALAWTALAVCFSVVISLLASLAARAAKVSHLRVVLVGSPADTAELNRIISGLPEAACLCLGQFDDRIPQDVNSLRDWVARRATDVVVVVLSEEDSARAGVILTQLADSLVPVCTSLSPFYLSRWEEVGAVGTLRPFLQLDFAAIQPRSLKRAIDLVGGLLLTIAVAPALVGIAFAIRIESCGPILFKQWRFGEGNRPFQVWKFRTMYNGRSDPSGERRTVAGDTRVTRVGRFLRRTSLDELPQLFNVLRGEMSLVGPRPHPLHMKVEDSLYFEAIPAYRLRHHVRPGITGLAQVSGSRGEVATLAQARRRVELDIWYVNHSSLLLDLAIVLKTLHVRNFFSGS